MTLLMILILAVIIIAAIAYTRPDNFTVSRSIVINAPALMIFPHLNNKKKTLIWSPFAKMDPNTEYHFEGPEEGVGAVMSWTSKKTGEGKMTVIECRPNELVRSRLEFFKPMKATNTAEFVLVPEGQQTKVIWNMRGENNFMAKVMGLFMNCEKMVGTSFASGLADLKTLVETK